MLGVKFVSCADIVVKTYELRSRKRNSMGKRKDTHRYLETL